MAEKKKEKTTTQTEQTKHSVEESFEILDQMVKRLESSEVTLEESFRLYSEGISLLKDVNSTIGTYEQKIRVLSEGGETEDLDS